MICSNRLKEGLFIEEPPFQEGLFLCGEFSFGMADLEVFLEGWFLCNSLHAQPWTMCTCLPHLRQFLRKASSSTSLGLGPISEPWSMRRTAEHRIHPRRRHYAVWNGVVEIIKVGMELSIDHELLKGSARLLKWSLQVIFRSLIKSEVDPVFRGQCRNLLLMLLGLGLSSRPWPMRSRLRHWPRNTGSIHFDGMMRSATVRWKSLMWGRNYRWKRSTIKVISRQHVQ